MVRILGPTIACPESLLFAKHLDALPKRSYFNSHNKYTNWVLLKALLSLLFKWKNWASRKESNPSQATQLISSVVLRQIQVCVSKAWTDISVNMVVFLGLWRLVGFFSFSFSFSYFYVAYHSIFKYPGTFNSTRVLGNIWQKLSAWFNQLENEIADGLH